MQLNALFEAVIANGQPIGRPLFEANRDLKRLDDPVERFWQNCTTLREHHGDGHVAALAAAGIGGCEAHLLLSADQGLPPEVFFDSRGWTPEQQRDAATSLQERGLLDGDTITIKGRSIRSNIETTTDALASAPFEGVLDDRPRSKHPPHQRAAKSC